MLSVVKREASVVKRDDLSGQARCLSGQKPEIQTTKITEEPTILDNFALAIHNKWSI